MKSFTLNTKRICLIVLIAMLAIASAFFAIGFKGNNAFADEEEFAGFKMVEGAQIKLASSEDADDTGIRFRAELTEATWKEITALSGDIIVFGIEVYPAGNEEAKKDFAEIGDSKDKMSEFTKFPTFPNGSKFYYEASITYNIDQLRKELTNSKAHNPNYVDGATEQTPISEEILNGYLRTAYSTELTARAYFSVNGVKHYVSNPQTRSIWGVAADAYMNDDPAVNVGGEFLLSKYFTNIVETDRSVVLDKNGTLMEGDALFTDYQEGDVLYASSSMLHEKEGYFESEALETLDYTKTHNMYKISSDGVLTTYTLNMVDAPFIDRNLGENVIADFDEKNYAEIITGREGYYQPTLLLGKDAMSTGATSGVVSLRVQNYTRLTLSISKPFKIKDLGVGLYFKIKYADNLRDIAFRFLDANGESLGDFRSFGELSTVEQTNDWTEVKVVKTALERFFAIDKDVAVIEFTSYVTPESDADKMILDEIGILGAWTDTNKGENVIADFDEFEYSNFVTGKAGYYQPSFLFGDDAAAVGADGGAVSLRMQGYGGLMINLPTPIKLADVNGLYFNVKYSNIGKISDLVINFKDAQGQNIGETTPISAMTAVVNNHDWMTIRLYKDVLTPIFDAETEIHQIYLGTWVEPEEISYLYLDEIGVASDWADTNKEEGVLMDFDEAEYSNFVLGKAGYYQPSINLDAAAVGATSGFVSHRIQGYGGFWIVLPETIKLSDYAGIYFKMKVTSPALLGDMVINLSDDSNADILNTTDFKNISGYVEKTDEWVTVSFSVEVLANLSKVDDPLNKEIKKIYIGSWVEPASPSYVYVDEVGVIPVGEEPEVPEEPVVPEKDPNVLVDFNLGDASSFECRDGMYQPSINLSGAQTGAETGVLVCRVQGYGGFWIVLNETIKLSDYAGIYLKMKVDGVASINKLVINFKDSNNDNVAQTVEISSLVGVAETGDYVTVKITKEALASVCNNMDTEVKKIFISTWEEPASPSYVYIDEVGVIPVEETPYKAFQTFNANNVSVLEGKTGYYQPSINVNNAQTCAESGVASHRIQQWGGFWIVLDGTIKLNDYDALYLKVRVTSPAVLGEMVLNFKDSSGADIGNGIEFKNLPSFKETNEWVTIVIDKATLTAAFDMDADVKKVYIGSYADPAGEAYTYVDEIGYVQE